VIQNRTDRTSMGWAHVTREQPPGASTLLHDVEPETSSVRPFEFVGGFRWWRSWTSSIPARSSRSSPSRRTPWSSSTGNSSRWRVELGSGNTPSSDQAGP
jgi:hypothetical protein